MLTFSSFNIFVQLIDKISTGVSTGISAGISAGYREGWRRRRKRLALVFIARLSSTEVELGPLPRRIPFNIA